MDKRSFNFLFVLLAVSMVVMVTYKVKKKAGRTPVAVVQFNKKAHN
jgi:hypothetical protein